MHRHKKIETTGPFCFTACANPRNCKPSAHGGVRFVDRCACGAQRTTNQNQGFVEVGKWEDGK